ncbi:MAG: HAD-IA family hydrolase [Pikeienuella sp.]|uniref:HAD-IA family hydrolase n=1 Tax=Pikeienuella sp. TaxID=2831957 RepID=UPI00391DDF9C
MSAYPDLHPRAATRRLFVINGSLSVINLHAIGAANGEAANTFLCLFVYNDEDAASVSRFIERLFGDDQETIFLNNPKDYIRDLSKTETYGEAAQFDEIFLFHTHNFWLHNSVTGLFPEARVFHYEEGTASYYPGLLDAFAHAGRIEAIHLHNYLGVIAPPDRERLGDRLKSINPARYVETLETLRRARAPLPAYAAPTVLFIEQYFFKKGNAYPYEQQLALYLSAVKDLIGKGYVVDYKRHPRERTPLYDDISAGLGAEEKGRFTLLSQQVDIIDEALVELKPAAIVGVSSTALLSAPHLFDIPAFRIEAEVNLTLAKGIPVERRGLVSNELMIRATIPTLAALPPAGGDARAAFWSHVDGVDAEGWRDALDLLTRSPFEADFIDLVRDVLSPETGLVSFDCFETLLLRPALHPNDIHFLLDAEFAGDLGPFIRFSNLRGQAIHRLRRRDQALGQEKEEYALRDIYAFMSQRYDLPEALTEAMREAEIALEARLTRARHSALALYRIARLSGKKIAIVSDTFFDPEEIGRLLQGKVYGPPDYLLASSEAGATKRTGALFRRLIEESGVAPGRILHIGDNPHSDIRQAEAAGLRARLLTAPAEVIGAGKGPLAADWAGARLEAPMRMTLGMIANVMRDNPWRAGKAEARFDADPFLVGYAAVGPALFYWTRWILEQAQRDGIDALFFLSRDGCIPLEIARRLVGASAPAPRMAYLPASRKAVMPLFMTSIQTIAFSTFAHGLNPSNTVRNVVDLRFGPACLDLLEAPLAAAGFDDLDEPIGRERLASLNLVIEDLAPAILRENRARAEVAARFYRKAIGDARRPAVVDVGYSGSSQRAIATVLDRPLAGYYFTRMEHNVEFGASHGQLTQAYTDKPAFFRNGAVLEYLITPCGLEECRGFIETPSGPEPVFGPVGAEDRVNQSVIAGARAFVDDMFGTFGADLHLFDVRERYATANLENLLFRPTEADLEPFRATRHEDRFGANRGESVLNYWTFRE